MLRLNTTKERTQAQAEQEKADRLLKRLLAEDLDAAQVLFDTKASLARVCKKLNLADHEEARLLKKSARRVLRAHPADAVATGAAPVADSPKEGRSRGSVAFMGPRGTTFSLSRDVLDSIAYCYSKHGGDQTRAKIGAEFELSPEELTVVIKTLGLTHDSLPFAVAAGKVSDSDIEAVVHKSDSAKALARLESARTRSLEKDALRWRGFMASALPVISEVVSRAVKPSIVKASSASESKIEPFSVVITPTDFHHGKYASTFDTGYAETREEKEDRLILSARDALSLVNTLGTPQSIVVGIGSDFFHFDNNTTTTTLGTVMDANMSPYEMLMTGCQVMTRYIDELRTVAPVELVLMAGNHDKMLSLSLLLYLAAWYRSESDVVVRLSGVSRQYTLIGRTLVCFTHGDTVKKLEHLARLAAIEVPDLWGYATSRVCFTGHDHAEKVEEDLGFIKYQLPSLSGADRWHHTNGYVGNRKTLAAVAIGEDSGVLATFYTR